MSDGPQTTDAPPGCVGFADIAEAAWGVIRVQAPTCATCRWYEAQPDFTNLPGECMVDPPTLFTNGRGSAYWTRPEVEPGDRCSRWEEAS